MLLVRRIDPAELGTKLSPAPTPAATRRGACAGAAQTSAAAAGGATAHAHVGSTRTGRCQGASEDVRGCDRPRTFSARTPS